MSKRFTDTKKWRNEWFRTLPIKAKLTWSYLCDECDFAGIWKADWGLASFQLDFKVSADELSTWFGDKIYFISADKLLIVPFFGFQYGNSKDSWSVKIAAKNRLEALGFNIEGNEVVFEDSPPTSGVMSPYIGGVTLSKVKVKVINLKGGVGENSITAVDLENLYAQYPRKLGKTAGLKKFKVDIKNQDDLENAFVAIKKFKAVMAEQQRPKDLMPYFSTFANTWKDYLDEDIGTGEDFAKNKSASPLGMVAEDAL